MKKLRATVGFQVTTQQNWCSPGLQLQPAPCKLLPADPEFLNIETNDAPRTLELWRWKAQHTSASWVPLKHAISVYIVDLVTENDQT